MEDSYTADNGFSNVEALDLAHQPIVECAVKALSDKGGKVIDFGSGNGVLLQKIYSLNPNIIPYGIEIDPQRVEHTKDVLPDFASNFSVGSMFEDAGIWAKDKKYALAILMPGRLLEVEPNLAVQFKEKLKKHCNKVLVYAYGDWLEKYGGLKKLSEKAGFIIKDSDVNKKAAVVVSVI